MKKHFKIKLNFIVTLVCIFVFLFPNQKQYGYTTHTEDEGPDLEDGSTTWHFTYYSDGNGGLAHTNPNTGSNFKQDDWTVNETYGWHEWTYNGVTYVVMAAATAEGMEDYEAGNGNPSYSFIDRQPNIHYFHYGSAANNWKYSTFQFQFVDNSDDTIYNGIILDTCELALDPSDPGWDGLGYGTKPENTQWLDVHVELGYPNPDKYNKFNGKEIKLSSDGRFNSGTTRSSKRKDSFIKLITGGINLFADTIQIFLNSVVTNNDDMDILYSKSDIEDDDILNEQIQVSDADLSNDNTNTIKEVDVSAYIDNKRGYKEVVYTKNTKIPIIPADIYSASTNKVNVFDIDFFNPSNNNSNKFWELIKNIVSWFSHIVIYLSAVLILVMLIWRSILLVRSSLGDDPEGASASKKIMDSLLKAICIVAGIYAFMTLMMYFYREILTLVLNGNDSNYLIRVNVDGAYSFNTNFIGYLKYMTLKSNTIATIGSSILYCVGALANAAWYGFMFLRMFIIAGLTIIAPMTAVTSMLERAPRKGFHIENILNLKNWATLYMKLLWIPLFVGVIMYKFLLYIG